MFGYFIGTILFLILFFPSRKIIDYIDPHPPVIPEDTKQEYRDYCEISINGVAYTCLKTISISHSYWYSADCDVLEHEIKFIRYELENPIKATFGLNEKIAVMELGASEIECYISDNMRNLISCNPICSDKIIAYRKSWKNKLSA